MSDIDSRFFERGIRIGHDSPPEWERQSQKSFSSSSSSSNRGNVGDPILEVTGEDNENVRSFSNGWNLVFFLAVAIGAGLLIKWLDK